MRAVMSEAEWLVCLLAIFLSPLAVAGLALLQTGFGRSRGAAHAMLAAMGGFGTAALLYLLVGHALAGLGGGAGACVQIGGRAWDLVGSGRLMMRGLSWGMDSASLAAAFGIIAAGVAAMIPLGACADRLRLWPSLASAAILGGFIFPVMAHWTWGAGWLAQLGAIGGSATLDSGGAAAIHALGGLSALALCWIAGARHGKYDSHAMAIPGHNMVHVLFGCLLLLAGWTAIDTAGALLFAGAHLGALPRIAINNVAASAAGLLASLAVTRTRYGKPDASIGANGFCIGVVSVSACCAAASPLAATVIGAVAGVLVPFAVEWIDRAGIDDSSGAIAVHALGGLWSLLAAAIVVSGQWLAQLAVISALLGFAFPASYLLNLLLNRFTGLRTSPEGERVGLDMAELGSGAYPDQAQTGNNPAFR